MRSHWQLRLDNSWRFIIQNIREGIAMTQKPTSQESDQAVGELQENPSGRKTAQPTSFAGLRSTAEEFLAKTREEIQAIPPSDVTDLIHELQVHQIELEMQNAELRKTQLELQESRDEYSDLYDFAPTGYFTIDEKRLICRANLTGAELLGVERRNLVKTRFSRFVASDSQDEYYLHLKQTLETGNKQTCELKLAKPDGTPLYVQISSIPILDSDGKVTQIRMAVTDISPRKQAEEALQNTHDELEQRVEARTAQLTKEIEERKKTEKELYGSRESLRQLSSQLLNAQEDERKKIARELHDSIGQSVAAIKFTAENALDQMRKSRTDQSLESLEALISMVQHAGTEIRQIYMDLRPSILDDIGIVSTISWFSREFEKLYPHMQIEQEIRIEEKKVPEALKIVVFRILQEALANSAKHSEADLARVSLKEKDGKIELCVHDEGKGFDFDQVTATKSLTGGLGLVNMKERTELSGGCFSVESEKGSGVTVRASWPMKDRNDI